MRRRSRILSSSGRSELDRLAHDLAVHDAELGDLWRNLGAGEDGSEHSPSPGDARPRRRRQAP